MVTLHPTVTTLGPCLLFLFRHQLQRSVKEITWIITFNKMYNVASDYNN